MLSPFEEATIRNDVNEAFYGALVHPDMINLNAYLVSRNKLVLKDSQLGLMEKAEKEYRFLSMV